MDQAEGEMKNEPKIRLKKQAKNNKFLSLARKKGPIEQPSGTQSQSQCLEHPYISKIKSKKHACKIKRTVEFKPSFRTSRMHEIDLIGEAWYLTSNTESLICSKINTESGIKQPLHEQIPKVLKPLTFSKSSILGTNISTDELQHMHMRHLTFPDDPNVDNKSLAQIKVPQNFSQDDDNSSLNEINSFEMSMVSRREDFVVVDLFESSPAPVFQGVQEGHHAKTKICPSSPAMHHENMLNTLINVEGAETNTNTSEIHSVVIERDDLISKIMHNEPVRNESLPSTSSMYHSVERVSIQDSPEYRADYNMDKRTDNNLSSCKRTTSLRQIQSTCARPEGKYSKEKKRTGISKFARLRKREKLVDYKLTNPTHTGYFRDQRRRIDMVMVINDERNTYKENLKRRFVRNCVLAGVELELEPGVQPRHHNFVFVKFHAPDTLMLALARYYGQRKYFKENHLYFCKDGVPGERRFIQAVRINYPGPECLSTADRILVVYRLLRCIPFGKPENYRGIDRLYQANIVKDRFALHDGPFFMAGKRFQTPCQLNGRQALFNTWISYHNLFSFQPIHLIREYMGERIAFLFSFFAFYSFMLLVLFVLGFIYYSAGLITDTHDNITKSVCKNKGLAQRSLRYTGGTEETTVTFSKMFSYTEEIYSNIDDDESIAEIKKECQNWKWYPCPYNDSISFVAKQVPEKRWWMRTVRYVGTLSKTRINFIKERYEITDTDHRNVSVCPKCKDFKACPFINLKEYCNTVKFKNKLDNPYCVVFSVITVMWGVVLGLLWKWKENYLYTMWEVREDTKVQRSFYLRRKSEPVRKGITETVAVLIFLSLYVLAYIPILIIYQSKINKQIVYSYEIKNAADYLHTERIMLVFLAALNAYVTLGLDVATTKLSISFSRGTYNFFTERAHELNLALMAFGYGILVNFGLIFYFAFIKGLMITYPNDLSRWELPFGLGYTNCGLLGCIDEVYIVFMVTFICKKCFHEFSEIYTDRIATDMSYGRKTNRQIPCWEKEMTLKPFTETELLKKYNFIMIQLASMTFFVWVAPLVAILFAFTNLFEMKHWARDYVLNYRRPLLARPWALGAWSYILQAIPFLAGVCSILSVCRTSNLLAMQTHNNFFPSRRFFFDFWLGFFNTTDFFDIPESYKYENGTFKRGSYADEWWQYRLGKKNQILYPFWMPSPFCLFPNMYNRQLNPNITETDIIQDFVRGEYLPTMNYYHMYWKKAMLVISFEQCIIVVAIILRLCIGTKSAAVRQTRDMEAQIAYSRHIKQSALANVKLFDYDETEKKLN